MVVTYLLTPESVHDGFTNALYALYELRDLLTPESDHHGFTNVLYALYELLRKQNHGGHSLVLVNT
jgi:hypothetical protein